MPRRTYNGELLPSPRIVSLVMHHDVSEHDYGICYMVAAWGQMLDHDLTRAAPTLDVLDIFPRSERHVLQCSDGCIVPEWFVKHSHLCLCSTDLTVRCVDERTQRSMECCKKPPTERHYNCYPVDIPGDDPFYKFFDRRCMNFARSLAGLQPGCRLVRTDVSGNAIVPVLQSYNYLIRPLCRRECSVDNLVCAGPRWQINQISAYIDGNFIYGSDEEVASRLRLFKGGRLKSSTMFRDMGYKDLLPMKTVNPDLGCIARPRNMYCFDAGDNRVNEQLQLAVMHTSMMREHNRVAEALQEINPHWDDETLYQETRRIIIAEIQHISYNEYLPIVLGHELMEKYDLKLVPHNTYKTYTTCLWQGYYEGYSPKINAGIRAGFQSAAYRFGHSLLPDATERFNKFHEKLEAIRLSSQLLQPYDLYRPGIIDSFMLGLVNQEAYRMDTEITTEVTNHLFEKPGDRFGLDLAAINMQRAREHGLPGYNRYREYCGLHRFRHFHDMVGVMPNKTIHRYAKMYKYVILAWFLQHGTPTPIRLSLVYMNVKTIWIPHFLNLNQKLNRIRVSKALLKRYEEEGDHFLDQIVTGDESWCYHYDPSTKRASMEWKRGDSPRPKKSGLNVRPTVCGRVVDDVDLWSAGIAEYPLPGALVGPTFACLIAEQFANIRRGDRFWYENPGWPSSFTPEQPLDSLSHMPICSKTILKLSLTWLSVPEQLQEIRKARLGRILCDVSDDIMTVQFNAMQSADPHTLILNREIISLELTPTHIFSCPAMAAALHKVEMDPEQQLHTSKIKDIATAVIEMHGNT
ncbi:hypothetical protein LAZ67_12002124 [Cordylochernes scorpioides]|uniref:Chorion peroxidase n=1 Tax=Cordylochernes scorpioides TaxID=51811 RepID=A0ABY6L5J5_9ARAC|nr:hypothetical protein LAZ67_12002124 [Cordylochernes scorpioides]